MALKALLRRSSPSPTVNDGINTLQGANPQGSPALAVPQLMKAAKQLFALVRRTAGKPKPAAAASDATTATLGGKDPEGTLSDAQVAASTVPSAHPSPVLTLVEPAQCVGQPIATSPTAAVVEEAPVPSGQTGEPATSTRSAGQKSNTKSSAPSVASQHSAKPSEHSTGVLQRTCSPPAAPKSSLFSGPEFCLIGAGGFGRVYRAKLDMFDHEVAIKAISKSRLLNAAMVRQPMWDAIALERRNMRTLERGRAKLWVPQLFGTSITEESVNFIMEYFPNGALFEHQEQICQSWEAIRFYIAELIFGLDEIHKAGFTLRDIKPENILVDGQGHIVYSDFGFTVRKSYGLQGRCGTRGFIAPEVWTNTPTTYYSYQCDYWSLGVSIYWLVLGEMPFGLDQDAAAASNYEIPDLINRIPDADLRDLICTMLSPKAYHRSSPFAPTSHKYLKDFNRWDIIEKKIQPPIVLSPPSAFDGSRLSTWSSLAPFQGPYVERKIEEIVFGNRSP